MRTRWRSRRQPTVVTSRSRRKKLWAVKLKVRTSLRVRAPWPLLSCSLTVTGSLTQVPVRLLNHVSGYAPLVLSVAGAP